MDTLTCALNHQTSDCAREVMPQNGTRLASKESSHWAPLPKKKIDSRLYTCRSKSSWVKQSGSLYNWIARCLLSSCGGGAEGSLVEQSLSLADKRSLFLVAWTGSEKKKPDVACDAVSEEPQTEIS